MFSLLLCLAGGITPIITSSSNDKIKAIQDRYAKMKATDPERQKMQAETMALYKEKGVNPASGCLPMLLTMPVLFAFYSLSGYSLSAVGTELDAIAATVIGGTLLSGGVGLVVGSLLGVLVLGLIATGVRS